MKLKQILSQKIYPKHLDLSQVSSLPAHWNKDWFHFVNINVMDPSDSNLCLEKYVGYFWATNNWVEIHCFDKVKIRGVYKVAEKNDEISICQEIEHDVSVPITHYGTLLSESLGFVFKDRKKSFIIPKKNVFYSTLGEQVEFYKRSYQFRDTVYCSPKIEDYIRWNDWHPDDYFRICFSGATQLGYHFMETHGDSAILRKLNKNCIESEQVIYVESDEYYITDF